MARPASILHALGATFGGLLATGRSSAGIQCLQAVAAQTGLATRWLSASTSSLAAEAAAQSVRQDADQPASTSDSQQPPAAAQPRATGFRRVVSERRGLQQGSLEGVVHIQNTFNNIILTLTDQQGSIKTYTSAGVVGYRGARKSQPVAAERAAEELARRALKLGYGSVAVRLKGPGNNKQYAVQSLAAAGLQITSLADVTPIPYNGCRPPKKRRV